MAEASSSKMGIIPASKNPLGVKNPAFSPEDRAFVAFSTSSFCHLADDENIHEVNRKHRRYVAEEFKRNYLLVPVGQYIIWPTGPERLQVDYYGIPLVAVYGIDSSICLVAKRKEVDRTRVLTPLKRRSKHIVVSRILEKAISDIEGHAFVEDCERKPFGFVSLPLPSEEYYEYYDIGTAISFLTRKMATVDTHFGWTFDETIKTAILGFLCLMDVNAEELSVTAWNGSSPVKTLQINEIQNYLNSINSVFGRGGYYSDEDMDAYSEDMDAYSYRDSDTNSYVEDWDMDSGVDRYATAEERHECLKLVNEKLSEYKNVVVLPRRIDSISFKIGGYSVEKVSITCVGPRSTHCWTEESYGLPWVAVHGENSICMVASHNDLDATRVGPLFKGMSRKLVVLNFATAVVSDIEDFADEKRESLGLIIEAPFGVVSVNPGMNIKDHEIEKAAAFLEGEIKNGSVVDRHGTIMTAIRAFQLLRVEEVKPEDIYVCCGELGQLAFCLWPEEILAFYGNKN